MTERLEEVLDPNEDLTEILRSVREQRTRLGEFVSQQKDKALSFSTTLQEKLATLSGELAQRETDLQSRETELATRQEELATCQQEVEQERTAVEELMHSAEEREQSANRRQKDLDETADQIENSKQELLDRAAELDEEVANVAQERAELETQRTQLAEEIQQLAERREHLHTKLEELDAEREECSALQARTEEQRHRLAERMQARRKELTEERAQLIAKGGESSHKLESLQGELESATQRLKELEADLDQSRHRCQELEADEKTGGADPEELKLLAQAYEKLQRQSAADKQQLGELQQQLEQAQSGLPSADGEDEGDEFRQRYEMALADLREERARIEDLESQLARAKTSSGPTNDGGEMDWEAQKRRLLAALESDFDEEDPQSQQDKVTVEEAVRATDQAIAVKEREIEQLQNLLEEQSANVGSMAIGAAAVADMLDKDELIRQERENLQRIQEEWREKLRKSEVDISLERAKLARDKAQIEEQLREIESQTARRQKDGNGAQPPEEKKGARGNWLARMGLKGE
ncbi:MAG: hypothetical protein MPJ50_02770 [Pirellulales bacterium]|nr:hypothetical protein [Pirellulales bacterium]